MQIAYFVVISLSIFIDVLVQDSDITSITFTFDFVTGTLKLNRRDKRVTPIKSSQKHKENNITDTKIPNKYWNSIREEHITQ